MAGTIHTLGDPERLEKALRQKIEYLKNTAIPRASESRAEIEREFVSGEFLVRTGPRTGQPVTAAGRRRRVTDLLERHDRVRQLEAELRTQENERERVGMELDERAFKRGCERLGLDGEEEARRIRASQDDGEVDEPTGGAA